MENYIHQTPEQVRKESIKRLFSEKNVKNLSLEQYIEFLKPYSSSMLVHSTRQGVRDHTSADQFGWDFHNAGKEKFHNNFVKLLRSGYMQSSIMIAVGEDMTEGVMNSYLRLDDFEDKNGALNYLNNTLLKNTLGGWSDKSAIHLSADFVPDEYYGAEQGNEIFIIFPSIFIASQHNFGGGDLSDGRRSEENNQWVYPKNEKGLDIDTGIVFLPADAKVNKQTGSKYELDYNSSPIKDNIGKYKLATDTVTSKEFWETYFLEHIDERPSKIVFYEGGDTNQALQKWKESNNLTRGPTFEDQDRDLGFSENVIKEASNSEYKERFEKRAKRIIRDYYSC